jgi:hypothetical protein
MAIAQEAYRLQLPAPAKGDVSRVVLSSRQSLRFLKLDAFGNEIRNDTTDSSANLTYTDTVLDQHDQKTTRFRRQFERAAQSVNNCDPVPMACEGKTVLIDTRDGKTQVTWEGGEVVSDSFVQQMEAAINNGKAQFAALSKVDPLPQWPVKEGETWSVDIANLIRDCESKHGCSITGATGTAKLEKVEKRGNSRFAVLSVRVHVPLKSIDQGDKHIALQEDSGMTWESTYDFCFDGTSTSFATTNRFSFLTAGRTPEHNGLSTRLRLETEVELSETRTPQQK